MISNQQLLNFLESRYYRENSASFIDQIIQAHPEFYYEGTAYRAVILCPGEKFSLNPKFFKNASWAKSFDGIRHFLENYRQEGDETVQEIVLVESWITGLDLEAIISHLQENYGILVGPEIRQIKREEEVLATKYQPLRIVSEDDLWLEKIQGEVLSLTGIMEEWLSLPEVSVSNRLYQELLSGVESLIFFLQGLGIPDQWDLESLLSILTNLSPDNSMDEVQAQISQLKIRS